MADRLRQPAAGRALPDAALVDAHRAWHHREVFRDPPHAEPTAMADEPPERYDG